MMKSWRKYRTLETLRRNYCETRMPIIYVMNIDEKFKKFHKDISTLNIIYIYNTHVTVHKINLIGFYVTSIRTSLKILDLSKIQQSSFSCKRLWKSARLVCCSWVYCLQKSMWLYQNFRVWKIYRSAFC